MDFTKAKALEDLARIFDELQDAPTQTVVRVRDTAAEILWE